MLLQFIRTVWSPLIQHPLSNSYWNELKNLTKTDFLTHIHKQWSTYKLVCTHTPSPCPPPPPPPQQKYTQNKNCHMIYSSHIMYTYLQSSILSLAKGDNSVPTRRQVFSGTSFNQFSEQLRKLWSLIIRCAAHSWHYCVHDIWDTQYN